MLKPRQLRRHLFYRKSRLGPPWRRGKRSLSLGKIPRICPVGWVGAGRRRTPVGSAGVEGGARTKSNNFFSKALSRRSYLNLFCHRYCLVTGLVKVDAQIISPKKISNGDMFLFTMTFKLLKIQCWSDTIFTRKKISWQLHRPGGSNNGVVSWAIVN